MRIWPSLGCAATMTFSVLAPIGAPNYDKAEAREMKDNHMDGQKQAEGRPSNAAASAPRAPC